MAIPPRVEWIALTTMTVLFTVWFYSVYWLADYYTGTIEHRHRVDFEFESSIPFWPWAILIYLTITPLLLLAPFVLRSKRRMMPLFVTLCVEVAVAGLIFVLFPAELGFRDPPVTGILAWPYAAAVSVNLTYNLVPSLHVTFALTVAAVLGREGGATWRTVLWAWALAIVASTIFAHQHHVFDVVGGAILTAIAVRFVHDPMQRSMKRDEREVDVVAAASVRPS